MSDKLTREREEEKEKRGKGGKRMGENGGERSIGKIEIEKDWETEKKNERGDMER